MDPTLRTSSEEKRLAVEMETRSVALRKIFERFMGSEEIEIATEDDVDTQWELTEEEKDTLAMIFINQEYDAINWALRSSKEIKDRCFSERDERLWRELILFRKIDRVLREGLTEKVYIKSGGPSSEELYEKAFYVSSEGITIKRDGFNGNLPIFEKGDGGKYYEIFENLEPNIPEGKTEPYGTVDSETLGDLLGELTPEEAYDLARKASVITRSIQNYFSKISGIEFNSRSIAESMEEFVAKYPDALDREGLIKLQQQGKAPPLK